MTLNYRKHLTVDPYEYQVEGIKFAALNRYCIIGDEMGLGKTLQALAIAFLAIAKGKKVLIVCPAFLRWNWWFEIDKFANKFYDIYLVETTEEAKKIPKEADIIIMGYSQMNNAEKFFSWADVVISDEAHNLKNMEVSKSLLFHKFTYEYVPERLILMTGTPVPNGVSEFYSLIRLVCYDPKLKTKDIIKDFPVAYDFCEKFAYPFTFKVNHATITTYTGLRNKDLLKTYTKGKYIRRLCKNVLDLPPLVERELVVSYGSNPKLMKEFNDFNEGTSIDSTAKAKSALLKAPFSAELAESINNSKRKPVVVFTDHVDAVKLIGEKLDCPIIHGGISVKRRAKLVKEFQSGTLDYLALTIGAGSEGNNLTISEDLVANDYSFKPYANDQFKKRIHRIGSTGTCTIHNVIGSREDRRILNNLQKKMKVIGEVL